MMLRPKNGLAIRDNRLAVLIMVIPVDDCEGGEEFE